MQISTSINVANQLPTSRQTVHFIEPDLDARNAMAQFLRDSGYDVAEYDDHQEYVMSPTETYGGCVVMTAEANGTMNAMVPYTSLPLPVIVISHVEDVRASVDAMKSGAVDFLIKPLDGHALLHAIGVALEMEGKIRERRVAREAISSAERTLTPRERQVFQAVTSGLMNKQIAYDLGISEIMVKIHRGRVMRKMGSRTLPDLVRKYDVVQAIKGRNSESVDILALN